MTGYSTSELDIIQERWKLRFPPDLVQLLKTRRQPLKGDASFDWLVTEPSEITRLLEWPFEGFWFDVENNDVWWPEWGNKPKQESARYTRLQEIFSNAPRLIPLFGHRYIPQEPEEAGNPVFSVWQTDVIYYGRNLENWIENERRVGRCGQPSLQEFKEVPFWSQAVRINSA